MGRMFLQILDAIAAFEHALMSEHTLAVALATLKSQNCGHLAT
jgi:DNA invertase Pin-like site-specific DNA recombinase